MSPEKQFEADPALRRELAELLANPTMRLALQIVKDKEATIQPVATVACDLVQFFALMGSKRTGYLEALANLNQLAALPPGKPVAAKPWDQPVE